LGSDDLEQKGGLRTSRVIRCCRRTRFIVAADL